MNPREHHMIIRWFTFALLACVLVQISILASTHIQQHEHFVGIYSEPSQYWGPENSYRQETAASLTHVLWHKVRLLYHWVYRTVFKTRGLYNTWNSLTQDQFYKPSPYMISKTQFPFLLKAETVCPKDRVSPMAVIVILSYWRSREERAAIRRTWASGNYSCNYFQSEGVARWMEMNGEMLIGLGADNREVAFWKGLVRHVFLFGLPSNEFKRREAMAVLTKESHEYGDIVVSDFHDSYRNLSIKSITGLRWASQFCQNAYYVIKTDQDVFIHVPRLSFLINKAQYKDVITGRYTDGIGCDVERTSRYAIPYSAYPFEGGFPPHVKGGIYIIPLHVARQLVAVAPFMPYLSVEDVHVTGVLRQTVGAKAVPFPFYDMYYELVTDYRKEVMEYLYGRRFASHSVKRVQALEYMWGVLQKATHRNVC